MENKCAFIILTYNSAAYVENCFKSVLGLMCLDPYIFVCDNGSEDGTVDIVKRYAQENESRVTAIFNSENQGTTRSRNNCMKAFMASGKQFDYVCVLDSDTIVNDDAVRLLMETVTVNPEALAAPRMFNGKEEEQMSVKHFPSFRIKFFKAIPIKKYHDKGVQAEKYDFFPALKLDREPSSDRRIDFTSVPPVALDKSVYVGEYAISACWFMNAALVRRAGLLDEYYFYAPEDVDYCACIKELGGRIVLVSGASIYHLTQRISKKKFISKMNWLHIKGLIYFAKKHKGKI